MKTIATVTCDGCEWGYCTDQVTYREPFGWHFDVPPHRCPNGCEVLTSRVAFDAALHTTMPVFSARLTL